MKFLFSSDLHGSYDAYEEYAKILLKHDFGILAGDQIDDFINEKDKMKLELKNEDLKVSSNYGLQLKAEKIFEILIKAKKRVYYVNGNHDIIEWNKNDYIINIDSMKVKLGKYSIVGVKDSFEGLKSKFNNIKYYEPIIDKDTIIVMHCPPYGVLDLVDLPDIREGIIIKQHSGNKKLYELINKTNPKYVLFGHIHENFGMEKNMINGSFPLAKGFFSLDLDNNKIEFIKI